MRSAPARARRSSCWATQTPEKPPPTMAMTRGVDDGAASVDGLAADAGVVEWFVADTAPWLTRCMPGVFAGDGDSVHCPAVSIRLRARGGAQERFADLTTGTAGMW